MCVHKESVFASLQTLTRSGFPLTIPINPPLNLIRNAPRGPRVTVPAPALTPNTLVRACAPNVVLFPQFAQFAVRDVGDGEAAAIYGLNEGGVLEGDGGRGRAHGVRADSDIQAVTRNEGEVKGLDVSAKVVGYVDFDLLGKVGQGEGVVGTEVEDDGVHVVTLVGGFP